LGLDSFSDARIATDFSLNDEYQLCLVKNIQT